MEQVKKEHYQTFCKHLPICDLVLKLEFLQEIQAHYNNNSELEMPLQIFKCSLKNFRCSCILSLTNTTTKCVLVHSGFH
jgi:hypothetical protein